MPKQDLHFYPDWVGDTLQFTFLLPLFVAIIGWRVVSNQADRRERRKDIRDLIGEARKRIGSVQDLSVEHSLLSHTDTKAKSIAAKTYSELQLVSSLVRTATEAGLEFDRWELIVDLRVAATGGNFDSTTGSENQEDDRATEVSIAASELIGALEERYFTAFPIECRTMKDRWHRWWGGE